MNRLFFLVVAMIAIGSFAPSAIVTNMNAPEKAPKETTLHLNKVSMPDADIDSAGPGMVKLKSGTSGHFEAEFRMNGRNVTALVDTGASTVAINKSTARRIGIQISSSDFAHIVQTANGPTKAARTMIREIQIGRVKVRDVEAMVLDDKALDGTLLGMTFLSRLDSFSVKDGNLVLKQ